MLSCWIHFPFAPHPQGPVPHRHGHDVAPRGVHLRPLQRLPGGEWLRGGAGPLVLRELLRAVLCSHLRPLPAEDSGGESHSFRLVMQLSVCRNQLNTAGVGRLKGGEKKKIWIPIFWPVIFYLRFIFIMTAHIFHHLLFFILLLFCLDQSGLTCSLSFSFYI